MSWRRGGKFLDRGSRPGGLGDFELLLQEFGALVELVVIHQLADERFPGVRLPSGNLRIGGQERPGFDMDQQRREVDEVGAQVDVEVPRLVQILEVLPRDLGDGDVGDLDFVFANQRQQQVERPFEAGQGNVGARRSLPSLV